MILNIRTDYEYRLNSVFHWLRSAEKAA